MLLCKLLELVHDASYSFGWRLICLHWVDNRETELSTSSGFLFECNKIDEYFVKSLKIR